MKKTTRTRTVSPAARLSIVAGIERNRDITDETPETSVALDAVLAHDPRTAELLVGVPCTIGVGSDRYAHTIVKVSASYLAIEISDGSTYRYNAKRDRHMLGGRKGRSLLIGYGRDYRDPSF